jgi:Holliday junction resolvase RusA-like endonuclease
MELHIVVPGTPQSKGSRTQLATGCNVEAGTKRSRARKRLSARSIRDYAIKAIQEAALPPGMLPLRCAVRIDTRFYFPIAKTRLKGKRAIAPGDWHIHTPDKDKLVRQVGDAIKKSALVIDDCIDAAGWSEKVWCLAGDERTEIRVRW